MSGRDELQIAYDRLTAHEAFDGSHVSLDRDARGNEFVAVAPDWIDGAGIACVLDVARDLELALALTDKGLRLERHTSGMVQGVEAVKRTLRGENDDA